MKILVTGTDGYIGSVLAPRLDERGHTVVGLDTGYYRDGLLYDGQKSYTQIRKDTRNIEVSDLQDVDAVIHLAELSNDPLGQRNPENTYAINHRGSADLAKKAKEAGVTRFIHSSSCSVYGILNGEEFKTETSEPIPQTPYAECKVLVEQEVSQLADDRFSPTFLRNATAYGPSPRMRFDIVLNNLAGLAWTTGEIAMRSDGTPWRPLVHVRDIAKAMRCVVEAPRETVHNEVFNVGATEENYQIRELAEVVSDAFPECSMSVGTDSSDNRSYRVSFEKIATSLPGFSCDYDVRQGAEQLRETFERVNLSADDFQSDPFTRIQQLEHLLETGELDKRFYWKNGNTG